MSSVPLHGRDHRIGGADPIPGIGSGGDGEAEPTLRQLVVLWEGVLPEAAETGPVWRIPSVIGASMTFELTSAFARVEDPGAGTTTVLIETSAPGGAFSATTVATLSISAAGYEDTDTPSATVETGDLVRIRWTAIGADPGLYTVQLEGTEEV